MDKKRLEALKKLFAALPEEKLLAAIRGAMATETEPQKPVMPTRPVNGPKQ